MIQDPANLGARDPSGNFLSALLIADWRASNGPIRLRKDLLLADVDQSPFFHNARLMLKALNDEGGTPATSAGNFNRAFVRRMFNEMIISKLNRESTLHVCKVINENDVSWLHIIRVVCECGGLVARRKGYFRAAPLARRLLPDEQAGQLYHHLFFAFFRRFDLRYLFPLREVPGIQATMAFILWMLSIKARDWTPVKGLAEKVLLPSVLEELRAAKYQYDTDEWILSGYVLGPLLEFGLIEKQKADEWPGIDDKDAIRVTALFKNFIHFHHANGG